MTFKKGISTVCVNWGGSEGEIEGGGGRGREREREREKKEREDGGRKDRD